MANLKWKRIAPGFYEAKHNGDTYTVAGHYRCAEPNGYPAGWCWNIEKNDVWMGFDPLHTKKEAVECLEEYLNLK